jgi:glycosyltransferase involved in cell wall biosynthesis
MRAIVATSPVYATTSPVLKSYLNSPKLKTIPLGIVEPKNVEINLADPDQYLKSLDLLNTPFLLFLGVLRYYKGVHTLIDAAKKINGKVVIAGAGPEEKALIRQNQNLGIKNVVFTGEVNHEQKHVLLKSCLALVLPSHLRSEAFGMVLIEASMYGKPMICCEIKSGTSYVNLHGKTGIVIEPENPLQLAEACNQLIEFPALALRMGKAARERYELLFSGPALGRSYSALYVGIFEDAIAQKNRWQVT